MEFLENAIFSTDSMKLLGAKLTTYRPEDYTSRAEVKLFTLAELREKYNTMDPRGFVINEQGALLSDTPARCVMVDSVFPYMETECKAVPQRTLDVTDVVLHGVEAHGFVLANHKQVMEEDDEPIMIPFKNFRVSASSFNIYAPFQRLDGDFRTCSLLDVREGGPKQFYCMFTEDDTLGELASLLTYEYNLEVDGTNYCVYSCNAGLTTFYASVGEAFLNYLAYNVSFYNIGELVLTGLLDTVVPKEKAPSSSSSSGERVERVPRKNIAIDHVYTKCMLREFAACSNESDKVLQLITDNPEAAITYQWMQKVHSSPWFTEVCEEHEWSDAYAVACVNLLQECKRDRLKCALELLTHRYFILSQGIANDNLGLILRGGGVDGESIKQSNFWYS